MHLQYQLTANRYKHHRAFNLFDRTILTTLAECTFLVVAFEEKIGRIRNDSLTQ